MQYLLVAQGLDAPTALSYAAALAAQGFGTPALLKNADSEDLAACGIVLRGHVKAVMKAAAFPASEKAVADVQAQMHANGKRLTECTNVLSKIVDDIKCGDETMLNCGVCEVVADLLRAWGDKDWLLALHGCSLARRLSLCGSGYVARLNVLRVPEFVIEVLDAYGTKNQSIALDGCLILKNLAPGWSEPRKAGLRNAGERWNLRNLMEHEFKESACHLLS
jgi:hypothetical protein